MATGTRPNPMAPSMRVSSKMEFDMEKAFIMTKNKMSSIWKFMLTDISKKGNKLPVKV